MELVDFLRARLDEDEAVARRAHEYASPEWHLDGEYGETVLWWPPEFHTPYEEDKHWRGLAVDASGIAPHIARHDPARVLAEVEARREIVALHAEGASDLFCSHCEHEPPCPTLRLLARPFRAHPDFDPAWLED